MLAFVSLISLLFQLLPTIQTTFFAAGLLAQVAVGLVSWIIGLCITVGFTKMALLLVDGKGATLHDLSCGRRLLFRMIFLSILQGAVLLVGFLLFVIPGVVLAVRLQFATVALVDGGLGPIAALKASWAATAGNFWRLFLFDIALWLVTLLGLATFGVGLLAVIPVTTLATAMVYRKLTQTVVPSAPVP